MNKPPIPPLHLRQSVGIEDPAFFDNPHGINAFWDEVPSESYRRVLDFGCGCGRIARQMLLQTQNVPERYLGVDLFKSSVDWCRENITPFAPTFDFRHMDVFNAQLNPSGQTQSPIPTDEKYSLVNAHSVFTHIVENNLEFYFSECVRVMEPGATMRATWFFFEKSGFPMMQDFQNCLYINPDDPTNATIYDLDFVRALYRRHNQQIVKVKAPGIRGHQWVVCSVNAPGEHCEFPSDEGITGTARPPVRMEG